MSNIDKQALRESAEKAGSDEWCAFIHTKSKTYAVHTPADNSCGDVVKWAGFDGQKRAAAKAKFIAAANPATVLALLDELEAKDKSISFLKDQLAQLANFNPDWDKLEAATDSLREHMAELTAARARIAELEAREVREERNQFLVVRYPGKSPVIKHCTGDLEEFLRQLLTQDNLATIDIVTHRYYGVGGQWVQDADEYLHMMDSAGRINGEG